MLICHRMNDDKYMRRCFSLAKQGLGRVSPNPLVGSVIVKEGNIIGEGYHQKYGAPHAEVNAIRSVENADDLKSSTIYVNLEPCSHHGKTPPCADLIVASGIPNVVVCNADPNPVVAGKGIKKMIEAGINVKTGVLENEGRFLNRRFFTTQEKKRPYIILKWAQSADGFMDKDRSSTDKGVHWISHPNTKKWVHKWRTEEDAILVGGRTIGNDNPSLTAREYKGTNPLRVVLSLNGDIPKSATILTDGMPTLVFNQKISNHKGNTEWVQFPKEDFLNACLADLVKRNISSVFVEGGWETLQRFIDAGLWDEARVITGTSNMESGLEAPNLKRPEHDEMIKLGTDTLKTFYNK